MATFPEGTAHSNINRMFSLYYVYLYFLFFYHFGFEGETLVLIALVPGHCLPFSYKAWTSIISALIKQ